MCIIIPIVYLYNVKQEQAKFNNDKLREFEALAQIYENAAAFFVEQRKIRELDHAIIYSQYRAEYRARPVAENEAKHSSVIKLANLIQQVKCPIELPTKAYFVQLNHYNLTPLEYLQNRCQRYIDPSGGLKEYLAEVRSNTWAPFNNI